MTDKQFAKLERLVRRLRFNCPALWGERGEKREAQAERLIKRINARLGPIYREQRRAQQNAEFERRYANDTAINYA